MPARFTEAELQALQDAVAEAERRTSGELVVAIAPQSHTYPEAPFKGALLGALVGAALVLLFDLLYEAWGLTWLHRAWGGLAAVALLAGLGALLARASRRVRRALVGEAMLGEMAHRRAQETFLAEKVYATRSHTGVLLFLSLFEHRIEVVADEGISSVVPAERWGDIVALVRSGILSDRLPGSIAEAVALTGTLLADADLPPPEDDTDELPNRLRILQP